MVTGVLTEPSLSITGRAEVTRRPLGLMLAGMDTTPASPPLPDRWWENLDMIIPYLIPDTLGLAGEPADTPRERVTDVIIAEVREIRHRTHGLDYAVPKLGSPHYGEAVEHVVAAYNVRGGPRIEVLDAPQGRVKVGTVPWASTLRLLALILEPPPPLTFKSEVRTGRIVRVGTDGRVEEVVVSEAHQNKESST